MLVLIYRLVSIEGLNPILTHLGYGFSGKTVLFITWGGLRGAVGLSLALVIADDVPNEGHKVRTVDSNRVVNSMYMICSFDFVGKRYTQYRPGVGLSVIATLW